MFLHILYKAAVSVSTARGKTPKKSNTSTWNTLLMTFWRWNQTNVFLLKSFINVECSGIFLMSSQSLSEEKIRLRTKITDWSVVNHQLQLNCNCKYKYLNNKNDRFFTSMDCFCKRKWPLTCYDPWIVYIWMKSGCWIPAGKPMTLKIRSSWSWW